MSEFNLQVQALTRKHFGFLEADHRLSFNKDSNIYFSGEIEISISADRDGPIVEIWIKSEPAFTRMNFRYYVIFVEKKNLLRSIRYNEFEESFLYISKLLMKEINIIMNDKLNILVGVLKISFEDSLGFMKLSVDELTRSIQRYKLIYDYIIQKDPSWNPQPRSISY